MESGPLPFVGVGRVEDAVTLATYTTLESEEKKEEVQGIFAKILSAAPKRLKKGERTRLQWGEGSICCATDLEGTYFYCVFTSTLTYSEGLAYKLIYDMIAAVGKLDDAGTAVEALEDSLRARMKELVEAYEAKSDIKELQLNGSWSSEKKPDLIKSISGDTLVWSNGEQVLVQIINAKSFSILSRAGETHSAELNQDDGKLHWSDGDVWFRREPDLTGAWSNASNPKSLKHIDGESLTWANGNVSGIQFAGRQLRFVRDGKTHTGELRDDDKIYWQDGDVWFHREVTPKGNQTATPVFPGAPTQIFGFKLGF